MYGPLKMPLSQEFCSAFGGNITGQPLLAFQRFAELMLRSNRLLINGIGREVVRISSQMSGLSTVSITFSFVKGPLAREVIALQVSAGTTFSQLKHYVTYPDAKAQRV
jgi:hypothetical protein